VKPSFFDPGSIPKAICWVFLPLGSWFNLTQKIPRFQNGVAIFALTHLRAREGIVGIIGIWFEFMTGTNAVSLPLARECIQPFATGLRREEGLGWHPSCTPELPTLEGSVAPSLLGLKAWLILVTPFEAAPCRSDWLCLTWIMVRMLNWHRYFLLVGSGAYTARTSSGSRSSGSGMSGTSR